MPRLLARLAGILLGAVALLATGGGTALAHVSVHADTAVQGGHAEITFRVPTESDTAATVRLQVAFPTDTPIPRVAVQPVPGWDYTVTRTGLPAPVDAGHGEQVSEVVSQIEWTATTPDAGIKPGEYGVFRIAAGPLPKADRLVFKVLQSYDDGQVARWIDQPAAAGQPEPASPAPVLVLASPSGGEMAAMGHPMPVAPSANGAPVMAWWALGITTVAVVAALWAVLISMRSARRRGDPATP